MDKIGFAAAAVGNGIFGASWQMVSLVYDLDQGEPNLGKLILLIPKDRLQRLCRCILPGARDRFMKTYLSINQF